MASTESAVAVTEPHNRLGVVGLVLAVLGLASLAALSSLHFAESTWLRGWPAWQKIVCGSLSPLGLLLSAIGIFRIPKGAATGGVVLGMLGTLYLAGAGTLLVAEELEMFVPPAEKEKRREDRTIAEIEAATRIIRDKISELGVAPSTEAGRRLIGSRHDGWGNPIHYLNEGERGPKDFLILSAGPDGEFGNHDDITNKTLAKSNPAETIEGFMSQPRPGNGIIGP